MIKKGVMVVVWFPVAILLLINNLFILRAASKPMKSVAADNLQASVLADYSDNIPDHGTGKVLSTTIRGEDGRVELLEDFMKGTPLYPYAEYIVYESDRYNMDYRIIPAIAMCESNLGKRIPSSDSYNAWGIAVYTGTNEGAKFKNWNEAITWVTEYIHKKFINKNIIDIKDIGAIYAPPSIETHDSWAHCVETFMRQIE